ncbi:MAG TPA: hypothetical protein VMF90_14705 [Rhizobiaceae bacterium]|nr:hypothetical protein [Rhizobiaceae bacterium]
MALRFNRLVLGMSAALLLGALPASDAGPRDALFDDTLFRKCINWMLDGTGGGLIENLCIEYYALPSPSIFQCARKVMTGFQSTMDQEGCAVIFEEQARKVRAGYIK